MDIQCAGCSSDVDITDTKKIGKYRYCSVCQANIIGGLKTDDEL